MLQSFHQKCLPTNKNPEDSRFCCIPVWFMSCFLSTGRCGFTISRRNFGVLECGVVHSPQQGGLDVYRDGCHVKRCLLVFGNGTK